MRYGRESLLWQFCIPILVLFVVAIAVLSWYLPNTLHRSVVNEAVANAETTVGQFKVAVFEPEPRCNLCP